MLTFTLFFIYVYYYWYKLLLITDIHNMIIYTFKVYFYPQHVTISFYSMYNLQEIEFVGRYLHFKIVYGFIFLMIIFPYMKRLLISMCIV